MDVDSNITQLNTQITNHIERIKNIIEQNKGKAKDKQQQYDSIDTLMRCSR